LTNPKERRAQQAVLAAAIGLAALVASSPAGAAVTIGSDLTAPADAGLSCSVAACTVVQRSLPGRQMTAPTDGVVVAWRIKVGAGSTAQPVRLRVVRGSGAQSTGQGASQAESIPATPGIYSFATRLPVAGGDFIGIDCCGPKYPLGVLP
jgi:hypothetical protein